MSTILKALRRLQEDEQSRRPARPLREELLAGGERSTAQGSRTRRAWVGAGGVWGRTRRVWVGAGAGALLVIGAALLLWPDSSGPRVPARSVPDVAAARGTPEGVVEIEPPEASPPVHSVASSFAAVELASVEDALAPSELPYRLPDLEPLGAVAMAPPVIASPAPVTSPSAGVPEPASTSFPVEVSSTVWHPDAARRLAVVRLVEGGAFATLREGDHIASLEVLRIEPAAVVFVQDGHELRRQIGSGP